MKEKLFTTGEFAKRANLSVRTIRYYDKQGLLKPSHMSDSGYRLYSDGDFAKLQKILTLKYLGFSLDEILELIVADQSSDDLKKSLNMQLKLVQNQIENLELVRESLKESARLLEKGQTVDWDRILQLIHMVNMEKTLSAQYRNSENVDIRIRLHRQYGVNPKGWFPWIYEQLHVKEGMHILELGCGNGELWKVNMEHLPKSLHLCLSDSSAGMVADAREQIRLAMERADQGADSVSGNWDRDIEYEVFDCSYAIPKEENSFDIVIANHLLFYIKNREAVYREVRRVLKPGGVFVCSTYGSQHMKEMTELVKEFDERINLSSVALHEVFGLEHGGEELEQFFDSVKRLDYEDSLVVDDAKALVDYILSCHGNQKEFLSADRIDEFKRFVSDKLSGKGTFDITKQAGIFLALSGK